MLRSLGTDPYPTILLLRHGSTEYDENDPELTQGWIQEGLSAAGQREVAAAARVMSKWGIDLVVAGDVLRQKETGQAVAKAARCAFQTDTGLRPPDYGTLTGQDEKEVTDIANAMMRDCPATPIPEGESWDTFRRRIIGCTSKWMEHVKRERQLTVLVTSSRDIHVILAWVATGCKTVDLDRVVKHPDTGPTDVWSLRFIGGVWQAKALGQAMNGGSERTAA
jgi:broad specificity phosphatase PhoE